MQYILIQILAEEKGLNCYRSTKMYIETLYLGTYFITKPNGPVRLLCIHCSSKAIQSDEMCFFKQKPFTFAFPKKNMAAAATPQAHYSISQFFPHLTGLVQA